MRYLVDSDWLIDAVAGRPAAVAVLDRPGQEGVATSIIALAELYEGAFHSTSPEETLAHLRAFLARTTILPVTDAVAERFARLRAMLRRQGMLISDMDLLIAATAVEAELVLVTRNTRHFQRITGLTVYEAGERP